MSDPKELVRNVRWLGHAGFQVKGSKTVYVDPWEVSAADPADVILVTHDHYDHFSPPDIEKLTRKNTVIVATAPCREKLGRDCTVVTPGSKVTAGGVSVEAVPAYNPGKQFHPRKAGNVGYVFTLDGVRYYHAGDTDLIPEMKEIEADIGFIPVGGTYTMDAEEAARAVATMRLRVVVPMHYGKIVGGAVDAERFAKACRTPVVILKPA